MTNKKDDKRNSPGSDGLDNASEAQDAILEEDVRAAEERSRSVVERAQKKTHPHLGQRDLGPRTRSDDSLDPDEPDSRDDVYDDEPEDDGSMGPTHSTASLDKDRGGDRDKKDKNDYPEIPSKLPNRPTKPVPTYESR